jgi:hypothetical protein
MMKMDGKIYGFQKPIEIEGYNKIGRPDRQKIREY